MCGIEAALREVVDSIVKVKMSYLYRNVWEIVFIPDEKINY